MKRYNNYLLYKTVTLVFISVFLSFTAHGIEKHKLSFSVKTTNKTIENHDGKAYIHDIQHGHPPYVYQWSKKDIPLTSDSATNLHEGKKYSVTIVDRKGNKSTKTFRIMPQNATEKLNHFFGILTNAFSNILMADIFALLNLYDPVIYDENGEALQHPNGTPRKTNIPLIVLWLLFGAVFFTIKFRGINIKGIPHAINLIRGKYDNPNERNKKGQISHFQALTTALSATVGLGNIAGVAFAISMGGPGATFWMILMGLLGMASKFTEATLGVKYRRIDSRGEISGGPMYYLKYTFGQKGIGKKIGKSLAGLFAILLILTSLGGGNMFQSNQSFQNLKMLVPQLSEFGMEFGILFSILVGIVIIGGITKIAKVTSKIVPFMASIYLITSITIILMNINYVDDVARLIFRGAFESKAIYGGFIGVLIMGIQRAAFSNEAGIGSAAIAHSTVNTKEPISEGFVALLEPFIDTVVICTLTAFILLFTGFYTPEYTSQFQGAQLTSAAFSSIFPWFKWILLVAILLFAFSTLISWSYYGLKGFDYLFGNICEKKFGSRYISDTIFKVVFLLFIIVGASSTAGNVINFTDMVLLFMAFPNIIGLVIFSPRIKKDLHQYWKKLKTGKITSYK
ncbi:MAG: alanine/glycine:cation symporter family protein [Bacteroidales bacterium]